MIFRNKDETVYKVEVELGRTLIPTLPDTSELKPLEDKVDSIKKAVLELEEVINYLLEKQ